MKIIEDAEAAKTELRKMAERHPDIANDLRRISYAISKLQNHVHIVYRAGIDVGKALGEQNRHYLA